VIPSFAAGEAALAVPDARPLAGGRAAYSPTTDAPGWGGIRGGGEGQETAARAGERSMRGS
jgi:hypothetical protein